MSGATDNDSSTGPPEEATLPPYTSHPSASTPRMVTHTYSLVHKKGHNWLTLNVQSRASSPDQFPAVIGDRPVQGNVVYDPKDQKDPKSITVKILGELVSESNIHFTFLEVSQELWPAPATHDSGGPYNLPFSLQLPPTAEALNEEDKIETFKIPPTDFARIRRFTVVYTLQVKVKYSSMFRSTRMLDTSVNYTPLVQPPPPSVLRQNAYSANSPIPAPDVDPEGWHSLPSITFEGKLFNDRVITFKYTLSLVKPLAYVRGSVVPLHLLVECSDADGLDLVSAPTAPVVRFKITSRANYDAGGINDPGTRKKLLELKTPRMSEFRGVVDWLNTATWWSTPSDKANARTLQGEIHLRPSLRPSALLGRYKVWYDVAMLEPEVPGFVPTTPPKHKILQRVEVDIATVFPNGPRPIAYSPPVYKEDNVDDPEEGRATMYNTFK